jgi:hypothetical protein
MEKRVSKAIKKTELKSFGNKHNFKGEFMKKVILALVTMAAVSTMAASYVTVTDCTGGESGQECRQVTYKVRPSSAPQAEVELVPVGEAHYAPAKPVGSGWLLNLLQNLSRKAASKGLTTPTEDYDQYLKAGG